MLNELKKLLESLRTIYPFGVDILNPAATVEEINYLEKQIGCLLPQDVKDLYLTHDGQDSSKPGYIFGFPVLSLKDVYLCWKSWNDLVESEDEEGMNSLSEYCESGNDDKVKKLYANPLWIPLTNDWAGNHIGIDLDPGPGGTVGQVINFGRDEDIKFVLADSLKDFIKFINDQIDKRNYIVKEEDGLFWFNIKKPKNTHFMDVIPQLFG